MALLSSDLFALDVIIDSVFIDGDREISAIPAVAFRFLHFPMQIVHLVDPEKLPVLQFADESVLLTTLQSDKDLYSFKAGKSCMFEGTFEQLSHAFSTSSRLLYIVLLDYYGSVTPKVKGMASIDLIPVFEELSKKAKRFNLERPVCAEASQHCLPLYNRSHLAVCGEVTVDVRLYYLGPRQEGNNTGRFSSFSVDVSASALRASQSSFKHTADVKENAPNSTVVQVESPVLVSPRKQLRFEDLSARKNNTENCFNKDEDEDGWHYNQHNQRDEILIHPPTKFRQSPLFNRLEVVKDANSNFSSQKQAKRNDEFFLFEDDTADRFRRQVDKAVQSEQRPISPRRPRSRSRSPDKQLCRHGKDCRLPRCKFCPQQPSVPRPVRVENVHRVCRCFTDESCAVTEPVGRFKGSWSRKTPLARVKRGITPSPPPNWYYLGKSRPKTVEVVHRVVEAPRKPLRRRRSRSRENKTSKSNDVGVNTDGNALVYRQSPGNKETVRILARKSPVGVDDEEATLVSRENDGLEDLVAEAMASFLVKQLKLTAITIPSSKKEKNEDEKSKAVEVREEKPTAAIKASPPAKTVPKHPSLTRRHTLAQLATFSKVEEDEEPSGDSEHTEDAARKPAEDSKALASSMGQVPDLPQYIERRSIDSEDSASVDSLPFLNKTRHDSSKHSRLSQSMSADYNDDTFESESVSGMISPVEPTHWSSPHQLSRRATVDYAATDLTKRQNLLAPPPLRSALRKTNTIDQPSVARTPTFVFNEDGSFKAT